jgi:hypothetical protein
MYKNISSAKMDISKCDHEFVQHQGKTVCLKCDLIAESQLEQGYDHSRGYAIGSSSKTSVLDKIQGVPEEVKTVARANMIRKGEYFVKKVRDDKKNTFKELYVAYQKLGIRFDPSMLTDKLGLSRKDVNCCLKSLSGTSLVPSIHDDGENYCSIVFIHPANLIEERCTANGIKEYAPEIKELTRKILDQKKILIQSNPSHVACAIIKRYCDSNRIPLKNFGKNNGLSDNALKKANRDIEEFFQD